MKISLESLTNKVSQVEDKISGLEDKVKELPRSVMNFKSIWMEHTKSLDYHRMKIYELWTQNEKNFM